MPHMTAPEIRTSLSRARILSVSFEGDNGEIRAVKLTVQQPSGKTRLVTIGATAWQALHIEEEAPC